MRFSHVAAGLLALVATPVFADYQRCAISDPSAELVDEARAQDEGRVMTNYTEKSTINVNVYFHVVTTTSAKGRYTKGQLSRQFDYMHKRYARYGINLHYKGGSFTVNNAWATVIPGKSTELAMKKKLRKGRYGDLNIYFLSGLRNTDGGGGLLGICYFPTTIRSQQTVTVDGCMVLAGSLPGGEAAPYNLGGTAVHESGHWFGLFHPFQGESCSGPGDYIADTPVQKTATSGCPRGKNSCPNQKGDDAIHNFMDYSNDACYERFTSDQRKRMHNMFAKYRARFT